MLLVVDSAEPQHLRGASMVWSSVCLRHLPGGFKGPGPGSSHPWSHSRVHEFTPRMLIERLLCSRLSRTNQADTCEEKEGKGQSCYLPSRRLPSFLGKLPSMGWPWAASGGVVAKASPEALLGVTSCLE